MSLGLEWRQGGEVCALTESVGSQHVEEQSVCDEPETDVVGLGMVRVQLPSEMLEGRHEAARGLCDPAGVHERVGVAVVRRASIPWSWAWSMTMSAPMRVHPFGCASATSRTAAHKRPSMPRSGSGMGRSAIMSVAFPPGVELVAPQPPTGADDAGLAGLDQVEGDHGCCGNTGLVLGELVGQQTQQRPGSGDGERPSSRTGCRTDLAEVVRIDHDATGEPRGTHLTLGDELANRGR